jgi:hypothetical protein
MSLRLVSAFYTLTLAAVGLPEAGALIGTGVEAWADGVDPNGNRKDFWDYLEKMGSVYSSQGEFESDVKKLRSSLSDLDFSSPEQLRKSFGRNKDDLIDSVSKLKTRIQSELDASAKEKSVDFDVKSELEKLRESNPHYQKFVQLAAELSEKKIAIVNQVNEINQRILALTDDLNRQMSGLATYLEEFRRVNLGFDTELRTVIGELRRAGEQRLKFYHYLFAKAYQYRFLTPYRHPLLLESVYRKMEEVAKHDQLSLSLKDVEAMRQPYYAQLGEVTEEIIRKFESGPLETEIERSFSLDQQELDEINLGHELVININDRADFRERRESNSSCD